MPKKQQNIKVVSEQTVNEKTSTKKRTSTNQQTDTEKSLSVNEKAAQEVAKKKRNYTDRYHADYGADRTDPGDNSRFIRYAMASLDLPPIDISDENQVKDRLLLYFQHCAENDRKPSMIGMANWLGVNHDTLNSWKRGEYRQSTHSALIQKACAMLEEMMVDYFQNGKTNPAAGIFLLKNMFGYKDVQDVVVTPQNPLGDAEATPQLADKYLEVVEE